MTPDPAQTTRPGINDIIRFVLEIFAFVSLGIWGFLAWPAPWQNIAFGLGAPVFAILVWGLFLSPKAVFRVDLFARSLIEIVIFASVAFAWWSLGQPIVALVFGVVAVVSGVIHGRRQLA
ncbi:YrdB family protein [Homoserinimonas sp. OAct 916]|uniref:YrdB family protein n=1 Tax=Homoserinimonas sp. OAct 916 TaxID=2211450 RepID=UPI000DBE2DF5|nr:YrdB family protein [Homoserinimonas sp. OAct 916]